MTYSRILIATDLSDEASEAAALAVKLAHGRARVRVVFVLPTPWPPLSDAPRAPPHEAARELVADWAKRIGIPAAEIALPAGSVARAIAREAETFQADLVVLGHRGQTRAPRSLLGSVTRSTIRSVAVDTLVVRGGFPQAREPLLQKILVATDFHKQSEAAAHRAAHLAKEHGSELLLVHVVDPTLWHDPRLETVEEPLGEWPEAPLRARLTAFDREHLDGRATEALLMGRPAVAVAKHARDHHVDLVAIGGHGATAWERAFLGSVAEAIVEQAPCSVLVVRSG